MNEITKLEVLKAYFINEISNKVCFQKDKILVTLKDEKCAEIKLI